MNKYKRFFLSAIASSSMGTAYFAEDWRIVLVAEVIGAVSCTSYLIKVRSPWKQIRETIADHTKLSAEAEKIVEEAELWAEEFKEAQTARTRQKKAELEGIVDNLEAAITEAQEAAQAQLEEQKQQIFNQANQAIAEKDAQIQELVEHLKLYEDKIYEQQYIIHKLELPPLPEGFEQEVVMAREVMKVLRVVGIIVEFRKAWIDGDFVYLRFFPRKGGDSQMKPHLERVQLELRLPERPSVRVNQGTVEFIVRNPTMLHLAPVDVNPIEPELVLNSSALNRTSLAPVEGSNGKFEPEKGNFGFRVGKFEQSLGKSEQGLGKSELERGKSELKPVPFEPQKWDYLRNFTPPSFNLEPYGELKQIEIEWVLYCKLFAGYVTPSGREKVGMPNTAIYKEVWNAKKGGTQRYAHAKKRLQEIMGLTGYRG